MFVVVVCCLFVLFVWCFLFCNAVFSLTFLALLLLLLLLLLLILLYYYYYYYYYSLSLSLSLSVSISTSLPLPSARLVRLHLQGRRGPDLCV